jgi:hypothetical protein
MLSELPDMGQLITLRSGLAYRAFERFDVVPIPTRLCLDTAFDGQPRLRISKVRGGRSVMSTRGRLDVGLALDTQYGPLADELVAAGERGRLLGVQVDGGVLRVEGPEHQTLMSVLGAPLAPTLTASFDVSAEVSSLVTAWVSDGKLPFLDASLRLRVRTVATRHPASYAFDPHVAAAGLAMRFGPGAEVSVASLAAVLEAVLADAGADPAPDEAEDRRLSLALRMLPLLTTPAVSVEPLYRLRRADDVAPGLEHIDLSQARQVTVDVAVPFDRPGAESAVQQADQATLRAEVDLPVLLTGRTTVALGANLNFPVARMPSLIADVRVPARPPLRPSTLTAGALLAEPRYDATLVLDLAPGEALDAEVRLRALVETGDGVQELVGTWRNTTDTWILLSPRDFPSPLSVVRISAPLAELATLEVCTGDDIVAELNGDTLLSSIPMIGNEPYRVVVVPQGEGAAITLPLERGVRLDVSTETLPGYGVHQVVFALENPTPLVAVECRPEGAADAQADVFALGTATPRVERHWVATSPFQPGIVWRLAGAGQWSAPVPPSDDLIVTVDAS